MNCDIYCDIQLLIQYNTDFGHALQDSIELLESGGRERKN